MLLAYLRRISVKLCAAQICRAPPEALVLRHVFNLIDKRRLCSLWSCLPHGSLRCGLSAEVSRIIARYVCGCGFSVARVFAPYAGKILRCVSLPSVRRSVIVAMCILHHILMGYGARHVRVCGVCSVWVLCGRLPYYKRRPPEMLYAPSRIILSASRAINSPLVGLSLGE